jgi:N-methylhydantoinase A/oxoprolinase/acetone carboxylase beta subunit
MGSDEGLWLGLDTGGTFTDAVLLAGGRRIIASAKALTTPWDLGVGIAAAIRAVLELLPAGEDRRRVSLVSVSTTLATNAVVENRFSPVCTLLIGFDDAMVERSGLKQPGTGGSLVRVRGGHGATGEENSPLDAAAVAQAVADHDARIEAYAVAANFSVRNPEHELRARQIIRATSPKPVTCAHELSSKLDAPRRALTAALNARLTPQIRHLIEALTRVLETESIDAPLMIVKGDGSLMKAKIALEYPVETILSGPAASVVGAGFLTGLKDFIVSDMGGTTTDIAVVRAGRPVISGEGALVGAWRTMVEAVDVRTTGLGGDSEVSFDAKHRLRAGPRKATPLCLLAQQFPAALALLKSQSEQERQPAYPAHFAWRNPGRSVPAHLAGLERRVLDALASEPRRVSDITRSAAGIEALRRLADAGLAAIAAFTPTDAMHVLERQQDWCREASVYGARVLAIEERNARAARELATPEAISERTIEFVVCATGRALLAAALGSDPGIEVPPRGWGELGERLIEESVAGRRFSQLLDAGLALATPLIGIGAPVGSYYPEVARRLEAQLSIPEHAAVCNAVGAVAGIVSQTAEVLVNQTSFQVFRVHDPAGIRDYGESSPALEHAERVSRELALGAARRAGAADPHVETVVLERLARGGPGADYLAEARVRSTATGRPLAGAG